MTKTPTKKTYDGLDAAYAYFNKKLFGDRLPQCLITVRPHRGAYGFFAAEVFGAFDGEETRDEIALNIRHFRNRTPEQILSTVVHEMTHLEQHHFGKPSRGGYHNKEWVGLMERVGLMPSNTGAPGGKRTGQQMTHYVIEGGPFELALKARAFAIPYYDRQGETETTRKKRKVTYTCLTCNTKVTGKPKVKVHCGGDDCGMAEMIASGGPGVIASYDTNKIARAA
jgi:predicted SprT family Zn-dependent metalloprotease